MKGKNYSEAKDPVEGPNGLIMKDNCQESSTKELLIVKIYRYKGFSVKGIREGSWKKRRGLDIPFACFP